MGSRMIEANSEAASRASFFHANISAAEKLERARTELLDLSARNRLLNIPRSSKSLRLVEVVDEKTPEVFRILVTENRAFTFLPGKSASASDSEAEEVTDLAQPADDSVNEQGVYNRHIDTKLQTRLTSKGLQKRLLELYFDARTLEEEQGVNILFLALGTLKWVDPTNPKNSRYAPLILIPVKLERGNAAEQFKLKWRQEDPAANLSLEAYLERVHSLKMPPFESSEEINTASYISAVAEAVKSKENWEVNPDDIVLGLFSFSKFLMYRDLDPSAWPATGGLTSQPLIDGLLSTGFRNTRDLLPDDASIDKHISPSDMLHIVDCDSSQALAVHDVRGGQNLVIQGPPGTGKSQTIANVIASAVADGKTVLFVAEKMAALEVVKRRLDQAGVGDVCLELHSNKANKRLLLDELRRTSELGSPRGDFGSTLNARLTAARDELNEHPARLHKKHPIAGLTPYQVIGELSRLRHENFEPVEVKLTMPETWSSDDRKQRENLIRELAERVSEIGIPSTHPWNGVGLTTIIPTDVVRLAKRIEELRAQIQAVHDERTKLAKTLQLESPTSFGDTSSIIERARQIADAPALTNAALAASSWDTDYLSIKRLLDAGELSQRLSSELSSSMRDAAWTMDVKVIRNDIAQLPAGVNSDMLANASEIAALLPAFILEVKRLTLSLGTVDNLDSFAEISKKLLTAERVAAAPNASPEAFSAAVWDQGVEQAAELAEAVATWEDVKAKLDSQVVETAFELDLSITRQALAIHGGSVLRFLKGDWRKANAQMKSIARVPKASLATQLEILDQLTKGRKALMFIRDWDELGKAAFGMDWRGERSNSAPLRALAEWMRSLRGLGAEPRMIATTLPDRTAIGERSAHVRRLTRELSSLMAPLWEALSDRREHLFPGILSYENASLSTLLAEAVRLSAIREFHAELFKDASLASSEAISLLDKLMAAQAAKGEVEDGQSLGHQVFDTAWRGLISDWSVLRIATEWVDLNRDIRLVTAAQEQRDQAMKDAIAVERNIGALAVQVNKLFTDLQSDSQKLFGADAVDNMAVEALIARMGLWIHHAEQLSKWVAYKERAEQAKRLGLDALVLIIETGSIEPTVANRTFDMAYYEALYRNMVDADPALARFDGHMHARLVNEFRNLDRERIAAASLEVVRAHHRKIPQNGGAAGPLGVLRAEMARRRGHMPIRQLMQKAAPAIQALKPVLMMSPLSVAQFLPPGQLTFDLLVMDEASQIQPVDAFGAIARCKQVVVVGDERQLPPTKFFSKMTSGAQDEDEGDEAQVADIESILGLFSARGLPQRMLRWHYRSRHQSLIAVSNSQFYENKLFIVPSPYTKEAGMGLQFTHIPQGIFDSGNTGVNAVEARAVAEAIIQHAKSHPAQSLGVATFSVKQRTAIQDQLELLRRLSPDTESYFNAHPNEPFFVKNLENVQGDERDVIFISVGYGRNAQGYMAMRFGPLSADGGERRLNVLISRAKRRCEVFSSITDEDIDLERGKGKGVAAFKLFLHFARTGRLGIANVTGRQHDSPFEVQVGKALQKAGYQVHPQVGIAGFFIDLAIADSDRPGRYLLGIECDGESYHSSASARDRDRLRQAVLEDHGWMIHRIWSADWFNRPQDELQKVLTAVDRAKVVLDERLEHNKSSPLRAVPVSIVTVDRGDVTHIGLEPVREKLESRNPYIESKPACPNQNCELHETSTLVLADLINAIVAVESPVHVDEIVVRLRTAWGLKRAGGRIQAAIERALETALKTEGMVMTDRFVSKAGVPVIVRDRSEVQSDSLRKPEMLPPFEIEVAISDVVRKNFGARNDEIILAVSRSLGFKATSSQLREIIQARIEAMLQRAALSQQGDNLVLSDTGIRTA